MSLKYLKELPSVTVNGKESLFINGVGYGIDGYCCEIGDELRKKSDKPVNYAGIAIKGLLFHFKPRNATVTADTTIRSIVTKKNITDNPIYFLKFSTKSFADTINAFLKIIITARKNIP